MPPEIEQRLIKRIRAFVWDHEHTFPINMTILSKSTSSGGLSILDLKARNKAIQATWLKSFLQLDESRPSWAFITDELINSYLPYKHVDRETKLNMLLQAWKVIPNTKSKLPKDLIAMLQTDCKLGISFEVLALTQDPKKELPIWYHVGANNALLELNNKPEAKCLRHKHQIKTVDKMNTLASSDINGHRPRKNCDCMTCSSVRMNTRCKNPHKCILMAQRIIQILAPKWNPNHNPPLNHLILTPRRKARNKQAEGTGEPITFDPSVLTEHIMDGIRIFTGEPQRALEQQDIEMGQDELPLQLLVVYTDGSYINTGQEDA
jgi:hypothetical protein